MTPEQFENLRDDFMVQEARILDHKRSEYSSGNDRLQNFREVADCLEKRCRSCVDIAFETYQV